MSHDRHTKAIAGSGAVVHGELESAIEEPNSKRFWRLNSIQGLSMSLGSAYPHPDPEAMDRYNERRARLDSLQAQEQRVQTRYCRMALSRVQTGVRGALISRD
jgi:hypothetical protein